MKTCQFSSQKTLHLKQKLTNIPREQSISQSGIILLQQSQLIRVRQEHIPNEDGIVFHRARLCRAGPTATAPTCLRHFNAAEVQIWY